MKLYIKPPVIVELPPRVLIVELSDQEVEGIVKEFYALASRTYIGPMTSQLRALLYNHMKDTI